MTHLSVHAFMVNQIEDRLSRSEQLLAEGRQCPAEIWQREIGREAGYLAGLEFAACQLWLADNPDGEWEDTETHRRISEIVDRLDAA